MNLENIAKIPFYFVRHGETDWNLQRKIMGQTDIDLNEKGVNQAYNAAYELVNVEVSKVFSSPLKRAYRTGQLIAEVCQIEQEVIDDFKERKWGVAEGLNNGGTISFLSDINLPEGAEKYQDFENRIFQGVKKMLLSQDSYPVMVAHGGVFKVLAKILCGVSEIACDNGQIFFFTPPLLSNKWDVTAL